MPSSSMTHAIALAILGAACAAPSPSAAPLHLSLGSEATLLAAAPMEKADLRPEAIGTSRAMFAMQQVDEDFWGPIDQQWVLGFETAYENIDDWVGVEWGGAVTFQNDSGTVNRPTTGTQLDVSLEFYEAYMGVHRTFLRKSALRPYVGAGLSVIFYKTEWKRTEPGELELCEDTKDITFGFYAHAGIAYQLNELFNFGIDARALTGTDVESDIGGGDVDYQRVTLFVGFGG